MTTLAHASLEWSLASLAVHGDTDILPRPPEFAIWATNSAKALSWLAGVDLSKRQALPSRRFIVPKDDLSYRAATQLDPIDSLLLTAALHQYGGLIEARRTPIVAQKVFSYRFSPSAAGDLYDRDGSWNAFWRRALALAPEYDYILVADIADFYNQVYHHTVENQLVESGWPNQVTRYLLRVLEGMTAKVSRGLPIGPHLAHLLAEATLIPVDNSLSAKGIPFLRYVDDIFLFAKDVDAARTLNFQLAEVLDKQQRLHLQKGKTRIMERKAFVAHCKTMIEDRPINDLEKHLLGIIAKYSKGDPYRLILLSDVHDDDLREFTKEAIETILQDYLRANPVDFIRLRWFLRRLAQVGHPAAIGYCLNNIRLLIPALSEVCRYFIAVSDSGAEVDWPSVGDQIIALFDDQLIQSNEYFLISLFALFGIEPDLNHLPSLIQRYKSSAPFIRREIILAAWKADLGDWLRELKEDFRGMDHWTRRAFLIAVSTLPPDERKFFLSSVQDPDALDKLLAS